MSSEVSSKKSMEEKAAHRLESKGLNGELLNEVTTIVRLSEGFVSSAETVEIVADYKSLLKEYVEQRTEALKRIEELAQKNLRRLTGDVTAICDAVLPGLLPLR